MSLTDAPNSLIPRFQSLVQSHELTLSSTVHIRGSWLQYSEMRNVRHYMHDENRGGNSVTSCSAERHGRAASLSLALDSPNVFVSLALPAVGEPTLGPGLSDDLSRSLITRATVPQKS